MRWLLRVAVVCVVIAVGVFVFVHQQAPSEPLPAGGERLVLQTIHGRIKALAYRSADASPHPRLIIVLHGDSPQGPPSYQYHFAANAAHALSNVVVAAILRPGYSDPSGGHSDGVHGFTTGDNYTPEVVDAVTEATQQLQTRYSASETILVGHSGGAAISADIMERHPNLASAALLVSCPCDLAVWRRHMAQVQHNNPIWFAPIASLSPTEHVSDLNPQARLAILVGANDDVAPPAISRAFADAVRPHIAEANLVIVPNQAHNMLLEPPVMDALRQLVGP